MVNADVKQLSKTGRYNMDIYCENPYVDPSSRYVMFISADETSGAPSVWRADLESGELVLVCEDIISVSGMAVSFDQQYFYCLRRAGEASLEIIRIDIAGLEQSSRTFEEVPTAVHSLGAISPDKRLYFVSARLGNHRFGILRFDLETGECRVIHEGGDDLCNAHVQIEPGKGQDLMIQHNRGAEFDDKGKMLKLVGEEGATLYVINIDGGNKRTLPVGKPDTWPCQGHQCWIGDTGEILLTISGPNGREIREKGCILALRPGDEQARVVARGHHFCHPNASRNGRFFVSDTYRDGLIVVGSIKTGKVRVLCESGSSFGRAQQTHPHPYFTPDCKWVIFNSDRTDVAHVYAARVPEGLLEGLDEE